MRRAAVLALLAVFAASGCVSKLAYGRVKTALAEAGRAEANAAGVAAREPERADCGLRSCWLLPSRPVDIQQSARSTSSRWMPLPIRPG